MLRIVKIDGALLAIGEELTIWRPNGRKGAARERLLKKVGQRGDFLSGISGRRLRDEWCYCAKKQECETDGHTVSV
jgi:hypothetical protein